MTIPLCDQMTLTVTMPSPLGCLTKPHLEKTGLPAAKPPSSLRVRSFL